MAAASAGHLELVLLLVDRGAAVNYMNAMGFSAVMRAALHGHAQIVAALCRLGADPTGVGGTLPRKPPIRFVC